jgi:hypothetical protein
MSGPSVRDQLRDQLEQLPLRQLVVRIQLLQALFEDLNDITNLATLERRLDQAISAHYTVYFERVFTTAQLRDIPRYLVHRLNAFGTPLDDSDTSSDDEST